MKNVEKLEGNSKELVEMVSELAVDKDTVYTLAGNYPVHVSNKDLKKGIDWYLLKESGKVCSFVSVFLSRNVFKIRNLYISEECPRVQTFEKVIGEVMKDFKDSEYAKASCFARNDDIPLWKRFGFEVTGGEKAGNWVSMHKMK